MSSSSLSLDSSNIDWKSSPSDEKMLLDEMNQKIVLFFQYVFNAFNLEDSTKSDEDEGTK